MANLKELRNKIGVAQSIRKVTAAMKLVAGVKLRKAEQKACVSRRYAEELTRILSELRSKCADVENELFTGHKYIRTEMLIIFASDRGLCGNFNYLISKEAQRAIYEIHAQRKRVFLVCIGAKLFDLLKRSLNEDDKILLLGDFFKGDDMFANSKELARMAIENFENDMVDKVSVLYTRYYSAMRHKVEVKNLIPVLGGELGGDKTETVFEPNITDVLKSILPYNIGIQIYQSALDSVASEQGSRMTSMDNATRNADELLSELSMKYNRMRQYGITQELVEVIAGAKAIEV